MKSVVGKLKSEIEILEERVNAKEMILKSVFSNLESVGNEHQLVRKVFGVTPKVSCAPSYVSLKENWCVGFEDTICVSFDATNISKDNQMYV
uniref:DUF641 domain-containing protein n=1 Tax=Angiostrongylus cantonensis TaxID=6313 RepID=A0A0K0D514_ANGCA